MKRLIVAAALLTPTIAQAMPWKVDYAQSHIAFAGEHAGSPFKGEFGKWNADIDFDVKQPEKSHVKVVVDITSASTGNATYDGTLPESDWLNSKAEKQAVYETTAIRATGKNTYEADGTLTLRGKTVPVTLTFTLKPDTDGATTMEGTTSLKRLDFDIGKDSDAAGEWVSLNIPLTLTVVATPIP